MPVKLKHVLIADDDVDDIALFESAISEMCPDLKLSIAYNGVNLLDLLPTIPLPDAIILDLNMPLIGGKECLVKIRSQCRFNEVPVIIFSTSRRQSDIEYCMAEGANHYIVKPNTYSGLKILVEKLCEGQLSNVN